METQNSKIFKYKLDFYYQSALMYLVTLVAYGGIRGSLVEKEFIYVMNDPILYVIIFFVLMSIGALVLNYVRNRRLVVSDDSISFKNRFRERTIEVDHIEWMHIGRERLVQTSGRFQVVLIKLTNKRRAIRIRVGRYEEEKDLINEMTRIAQRVPKRPRWGAPRFTDR